jgi:NADH:ubiquinone oxidoreductase subunit 3 (subunit A)
MLVDSTSFTTKILLYIVLYLLVCVFDVEACSIVPGQIHISSAGRVKFHLP